MITSYSILGQECPSGTSEVLFYTVPTGVQLVVSTISVCNVATIASGTEARYDVIMRPSGVGTTAAEHYVAKNVVVRPGEFHALTTGYTASSGDTIYVVSSVADTLAFNLSGSLISEVIS